MDPVTLGIGVAVAVGIATVVAIVTKFGFGGESEYEQQIARQKEILFDETKAKTTDKKKVKAEKKKKSTTVKVKGDGGEYGSGSEIDVEVDSSKEEVDSASDALAHPHIEYDPDPVIIDTAPQVSKTTKKNRARRSRWRKMTKMGGPSLEVPQPTRALVKKTAPNKSILVNRDETPLVRGEDAVIAETVYPETSAPKDDIELKHKPKKSGKKDKSKQTQAPVQETAPVVDEVVVPTQVKSQASAPTPVVVREEMVATSSAPTHSAPAPTRKNKVKAGSVVVSNKTGSDLSSVIEVVQQAHFSKDELQTLVDSILARQESEGSWTTKSARPDPVAVLRKQLEETQNALTGEQSNVASAQAKIKEVTAKWTAAEKMSTGYTAQMQDMQKLNQKLKAEVQSVKDGGYQDRQKVEQQKEIINQLSEENQRLKQSVANTDEVTDMQNQLRTLKAEKQTWGTQSAETAKDLADVKHQLARLQESLKAMEGEKADFKKRCDDLGQKLAQAETLAMEAQNRAKESEKNNKNLQDHIRSQQKDKETEIQTFKDELAMAKESQIPSTNGNHSNGDANGLPDNAELESKIASLEQSLQDKESELANVNKQLAVARTSQTELSTLKQQSADEVSQRQQAEAKLAKLQTQIQTLKEKNDELRRKNWGLVESLDKVETTSLMKGASEKDIEEKVCTINLLKDNNSKLQSENNELQERCAQMSSLTDEVTQLKKQVNIAKASLDARGTTISQLEESLQAERQKVSATESECRDILEKEFSRTVQTMSNEHGQLVDSLRSDIQDKQSAVVALEKSLHEKEAVIGQLTECKNAGSANVDKLKEQISNLNKEIETLRSSNQSVVPEPSNVEDSASVDKYRNCLTEVESMLDKLGVRVEQEYNKLALKLSSKDKELTQVKEKLTSITSQLEESKQKIVELSGVKTELAKAESSLKDEQLKNRQLAQHLAAAMASSGSGDDSGTCV